MFNWIDSFFTVMVWWKWIIAFLFGCGCIAVITTCAIGIKYLWEKLIRGILD